MSDTLPVSDTVSDTGFYAGAVSDTRNHSPKIAVRLAQSGLAWLDGLASETGRSRTDVIKACLQVARMHERELRARLTTGS